MELLDEFFDLGDAALEDQAAAISLGIVDFVVL
jgi:hypothetical protein